MAHIASERAALPPTIYLSYTTTGESLARSIQDVLRQQGYQVNSRLDHGGEYASMHEVRNQVRASMLFVAVFTEGYAARPWDISELAVAWAARKRMIVLTANREQPRIPENVIRAAPIIVQHQEGDYQALIRAIRAAAEAPDAASSAVGHAG